MLYYSIYTVCLLLAICTLIWRELNSNGLQCTDDTSVSGLTCNYDCLALVVWHLHVCVWAETIHYYWYIYIYKCRATHTHVQMYYIKYAYRHSYKWWWHMYKSNVYMYKCNEEIYVCIVMIHAYTCLVIDIY